MSCDSVSYRPGKVTLLRPASPTALACLARSVVLLALLSSPHAAGQQCNDLTRTKQQEAGTTSSSTNCAVASVTVSILGQSATFTTPSSCLNSKTTYAETIYSCGPAATGIHCSAHGFPAAIKVWRMGGANPCPIGWPASFDSFAAASKAFSCADLPLVTDTYDWSASVKNCGSGTAPAELAHGAEAGDAEDRYLIWNLDPRPGLPGPTQTPMESFVAAISTLDPAALPSPLAAVWSAHAPIDGVADLSAKIVYHFAAEPGSVIENSYYLSGVVRRDGRFYLERSQSVTRPSEAPLLLVEQLSFDGATFFWGTRGAPRYNAWASSSARRDAELQRVAPYAAILVDWVKNPFFLSLVPGYELTTEVLGSAGGNPTRVRVSASHPQLAPALRGTARWTIDLASGHHPESLELLTPGGEVHRRFTYSDWKPIVDGNWRPFRIVEERFAPGSSAPVQVVTTQILAGVGLPEDELGEVPRARPAQERWYLRR